MDELLSELPVVEMQLPDRGNPRKMHPSQQEDVTVPEFRCSIDSNALLQKAKLLHNSVKVDTDEMQLWVSLNKFSGTLVPPEVTQPGANTMDAQMEMRRAWQAHKVAHTQFWDELDKRLVDPVNYDNTNHLVAAMTAFAQNMKAVVRPTLDPEREPATIDLVSSSLGV